MLVKLVLLLLVCVVPSEMLAFQRYTLARRQADAQRRAAEHARHVQQRESLRLRLEDKKKLDSGDALLDSFRKDTKKVFNRDKLYDVPKSDPKDKGGIF